MKYEVKYVGNNETVNLMKSPYLCKDIQTLFENELKYTLTDLMEQSMNDDEIKIKESILHHSENVDLIPSNLSLSALENSLTYAMSREYTLRNCLSSIKDDYDYILLDCQPSLGMLTINALASANSVIIPVQSDD